MTTERKTEKLTLNFPFLRTGRGQTLDNLGDDWVMACAVLAIVQQSEAQFGGGDNVGPFLFPGNGANPIGRPPRPPRPGGSTTTRRPSVGGSGCNCPTTPEYNPTYRSCTTETALLQIQTLQRRRRPPLVKGEAEI
ncbi:hypothetical protein J437_LFUL002216 [Ladona fulva]|uniref:Uncharacterized protein n=1 Tax=Ladona fulva TaxID=123851 RepID=A0A8K0JZF9_LADFU|nr:hypothetical protein J437_LFUL002216 [Ladona fulva]